MTIPQFARRSLRWPAAGAALAAAAALAAPAVASAAPTGLFVGDYSTTTISQFTIGSGGLLSPNGTAPTGQASWMLAATPNGKYLYGTNYTDGTVSQYKVGLDGILTPLSPATVPTGAHPEQIAVSPNGKNVYVASVLASTVSVYDVGPSGKLSLLQTVSADVQKASGVVVSPNGASVYVADDSTTPVIAEFKRNSAGKLTPKATPTIPTAVSGDLNLVITPNGKYVYASGTNTALVAEYSVGSGGKLAPQPTPTIAMGIENDQLSVSPNGKNLYAAACTTGVWQYKIGTTGELSALTPAVVPSGGSCPDQQWMTSKGANLYAGDYSSSDVSQFKVSSTGALTLLTPPTAPAGSGASDVVIAPDQGPVARFSAKAGRAGKATKFNALKSSDSDGKVVRYHWKFGDGHTLTTGKAKVSHKYKKAGKHKVTLTVTDDSGCSIAQVFTGQTAYCNGTQAARVTHRVKIRKRKK